MRQAGILSEPARHLVVPFPSLAGPEGPLNQVDKPNTFLLALPTGLKLPGRQANYSLPYQPSAPRHPTNQVLLMMSSRNREA